MRLKQLSTIGTTVFVLAGCGAASRTVTVTSTVSSQPQRTTTQSASTTSTVATPEPTSTTSTAHESSTATTPTTFSSPTTNSPPPETSTSVPTTTVPATTQTSPYGVGPVIITGPEELCPSGTFGGLYATQISISHVSCEEAYTVVGEFNNNPNNNFTDSAGTWNCDVVGPTDQLVSCRLYAGTSPSGGVSFKTPDASWGPG